MFDIGTEVVFQHHGTQHCGRVVALELALSGDRRRRPGTWYLVQTAEGTVTVRGDEITSPEGENLAANLHEGLPPGCRIDPTIQTPDKVSQIADEPLPEAREPTGNKSLVEIVPQVLPPPQVITTDDPSWLFVATAIAVIVLGVYATIRSVYRLVTLE